MFRQTDLCQLSERRLCTAKNTHQIYLVSSNQRVESLRFIYRSLLRGQNGHLKFLDFLQKGWRVKLTHGKGGLCIAILSAVSQKS